MRIENIGRILAIKYAQQLPSNIDKQGVLEDIARDVKGALQSYVFDTTSKNPIIQYLDRRGYGGTIDLFVKYLISESLTLYTKIDELIKEPVQDRLLMIMMNIKNDILQGKKAVVEALKHSLKLNNESSRNEANRLASKFDITVTNLADNLTRKGRIVYKYCSPEFQEIAADIIKAKVESQRMPLTKMQLFIFAHTPVAEKYGLTSIEILQRLLEDPEMREKLTTVINAVHRGHNFPKNGPEILEEAQAIAKRMQMQQPNKTLELPEGDFREALNVFVDPAERASHVGVDAKKRLEEERAIESGGPEGSGETETMSPEELEQKIQERDELARKNQEQLNKPNKERSFLLDQLLRMNR
jgi:hypothetical protein